MIRIFLPALLCACTGKPGESSATDSAPPPAPGTGETDSAPPTDSQASACPVEGAWSLHSIHCDGVDRTADYLESYEQTTALVSLSPSEEGCFVEQSYEATYCQEMSQMDATALSGDQWSILGFGVSACKPVGCTFDKEDIPCKIGDRAGQWSETWTATDAEWVRVRDNPETGWCAREAAAAEQRIYRR